MREGQAEAKRPVTDWASKAANGAAKPTTEQANKRAQTSGGQRQAEGVGARATGQRCQHEPTSGQHSSGANSGRRNERNGGGKRRQQPKSATVSFCGITLMGLVNPPKQQPAFSYLYFILRVVSMGRHIIDPIIECYISDGAQVEGDHDVAFSRHPHKQI